MAKKFTDAEIKAYHKAWSAGNAKPAKKKPTKAKKSAKKK